MVLVNSTATARRTIPGAAEQKAAYLEARKHMSLESLVLLILVAEGAKPAAEISVTNSKFIAVPPEMRECDAKSSNFSYLPHRRHLASAERLFERLGINFNLIRDKPTYKIDLEKMHYRKIDNSHTYAIGLKKTTTDKLASLIEGRGCKSPSSSKTGAAFGFPKCCIQLFKLERDPSWKRFHDNMHNTHADRCISDKRTYVFHVPCKPNCRKTNELSKKYRETLLKAAPEVLREYEADQFENNQDIFRIANCITLRRNN